MEHRLWLLTHSHRQGISHYPIVAKSKPNPHRMVKRLGIDFEPDRDENVEIEELDEFCNLQGRPLRLSKLTTTPETVKRKK